MVTNDKEQRKKWDRKYREKNRDKIRKADKKWRDGEKGKISKKEWRDDNAEKILGYNRRYRKDNKDKCNEKGRRHYYTTKGTATMLRKHDARRLEVKKSKLTWQIIEMINKRDKECVYCGCELNGNVEYDHINPFRPFCKNNIVRACGNCNKDKSRADMIQWMNFKGYKVSEKLLDLHKKAYY